MAKMRFAKVVAVMVAVAVVAVGCSSRKKKKHTPQSLAITTTSLPDATEGVAYSYTLSASGGNSSNYSWSISGQPLWLSINSATGELSGTPPAGSGGTSTFTVEVTDGQQTASRQFDLVVNPAGVATGDWYVDATNGSNSNSGTSWSEAFKTIAHALNVAQNGDTIVVADGTYYEHDLDFRGKKVHLRSANGAANCIIDCQQQGRAFRFHSGETADSILEGFTIQNGRVEDTYGGAIVCENNSSPTITNCVFENNEAVDTDGSCDDGDGGAIYCDASSPRISDCTFSGNSATGGESCGGAICCRNSSSLTIANCTFDGNESLDSGGAIYCDASSMTVSDCTFSSNSASGGFGYGGAIYCYPSSSMTLTDCTFTFNTATTNGGAILCWGSSLSITNCAFSDNSVTNWDGGAILSKGSDLTATNCVFGGNGADAGGAISCDGGNLTLTNCTFSGNIGKGRINAKGGAIYCKSISPRINNCTFYSNSAGYGGAIYCFDNSTPTLSNCILWRNSADTSGNEIYADSGCTVTLNHCCVDNSAGAYDGSGAVDDSNNCIYDDPLFVDAANGDYHLKDSSPCIDAGDNSLVTSGVDKDLDGNQRIVDGDSNGTATVDIGAYEYQP